MKRFKIKITKNEITLDDFNEFMKAKTISQKVQIITLHSLKNKKRIDERRILSMENKTQQQYEKEMLELNKQFSEFLHTKGLGKKFKLAFSNMAESARKQKEIDKANFTAVKAKSEEENKEFVELLHTKGLKAKFRLVVENIKKGARESSQRTAEQIAKAKAQTAANIARANSYNHLNSVEDYTAESLAEAFNEFLKTKGLENEYSVEITEINE